MSESPIFDPFRENKPEPSASSHPHASSFSLGTTVSLKVAEDSPLCHKPRVTLAAQRSSARFGTPSHSPFFCRNNPHPQRVRHIKGINDKPVCAVNDVTFGQMPQYCLGRVLTPEKNLVLQSNIPTAARGTNSTSLPIDVLTGLQFFLLKQTDSHSLRRMDSASTVLLGVGRELISCFFVLFQVTEAWREELPELTERAGLLRPGGREKDQALSLLCSALAKDPHSAYEALGGVQLTVKEVQNLPPASRMVTISEEDTTRDHSLEMMSNCDSGKLEDADTERAESKTPRERHSARPLSTQRTLGSPTVCHLNQKVVLRYTKRAPMPHTPPGMFQAEWPNYTVT